MPFTPADGCDVVLLPSGNIRALDRLRWVGTQDPPDVVDIEAGAESDQGTIPWPYRSVLPHDGPAGRAFIVHDELCRRVHAHWRAVREYEDAVRETEGPDIGRLAGLTPPSRPEPLDFDPVDTDAVMRVILAELGVGWTRWLYWEGVRLGALGSAARRQGFLRPKSLLPFLALLPVAFVVLIWAAAGALVSRALIGLVAALTWPWERRARARRRAVTASAVLGDTIRTEIARAAARPRTGRVGPGEPVPDPDSFWRCLLCGEGGSPADRDAFGGEAWAHYKAKHDRPGPPSEWEIAPGSPQPGTCVADDVVCAGQLHHDGPHRPVRFQRVKPSPCPFDASPCTASCAARAGCADDARTSMQAAL